MKAEDRRQKSRTNTGGHKRSRTVTPAPRLPAVLARDAKGQLRPKIAGKFVYGTARLDITPLARNVRLDLTVDLRATPEEVMAGVNKLMAETITTWMGQGF